jgi:hypothetical protein
MTDIFARGLATNIKSDQLTATNIPQTGQIPSSDGDGGFTWVDNGGAGTDTHDLKISANDTTPNFLEQKLVGTTDNISVTVLNDGVNEQLKLDIGANVFNKTTDDTDDITEGDNKFVSATEKTAITHTNRTNLDEIDQDLSTTDSPTFAQIKTPSIKTDTVTPTDLTIVTGAEKTIVLNTPVYKDLIVYALNLRGGSTPPQFAIFQGNLYGQSFENNATDILYGCVEFQHDYKEGTDIEVHIHWSPSSTNTGNCRFTYEYTIANRNSAFSVDTTLTALQAGSGVVNQHQYLTMGTISGVGRKIGDMICFAIARTGSDAADTFTGNAFVHSIGIHYEVDTCGSRTRSAK